MNQSQVTPNHNLTFLRTEIAPSWVADPETRGSWSLLYSCLFTLGLCVWTAVHLNVPAFGESPRRQFFRKVKYLFLAIFAPEVIVFTAWQQRFRARQLCDQLNEIRKVSEREPEQDDQQNPSTSPAPGIKTNDKAEIRPVKDGSHPLSKPSFSLTHGFNAVMGGFAVDVSDMHDRLSWLTLTPAGMVQLAKLGRFKDLLDDDIKDKSKADWLAKSLVILQVSWMVLQCISRQKLGFPLSPLEVHTLVHAGCAVLMYYLWFKKPLDVNRPTLIDTTGLEEPLALMLLQSAGFGWLQYNGITFSDGYTHVGLNYSVLGRWPNESSSEASYLMVRGLPSHTAETSLENSSSMHYGKPSRDRGRFKDHSSPEIQPRPTQRVTQKWPKRLTPSPRSQKDVENQNSLERQVELTWGPSPELSIAYTLTSGETLTQGVGPIWFPLQLLDKPRTLLSRLMRLLKRKLDVREKFSEPDDHFIAHSMNGKDWYPHKVPVYKFSMSLSPKDVLRWDRAGAELKKTPQADRSPGPQNLSEPIPSSDREGRELDYLTLRSKNFSTELLPTNIMEISETPNDHSHSFASVLMFMLLLVLGILYGGMHLTLWNYTFATRTELMLWRISGITLIAVPILVVGSSTAIKICRTIRFNQWEKKFASRYHFTSRRLHNVCEFMRDAANKLEIVIFCALTLAAMFCMPLYVFSRVFIVVESFISLHHMPIGVFVQPDWTRYIPHL